MNTHTNTPNRPAERSAPARTPNEFALANLATAQETNSRLQHLRALLFGDSEEPIDELKQNDSLLDILQTTNQLLATALDQLSAILSRF
jgi:hypothetical protein